MDCQRHFKEINERMEHLICFYPFFKAYNTPSVQNRPYDVAYLSLGVLTFLIEKGRLQGRTVGPEEIQGYIREMMKELYPEQEFDYREVMRTVLDSLEVTPGGERYLFRYPDPLRKQQVERYVHLIEYDVSDEGYQITDEGLEFMINIKELPEESRVSVTLILFNKQIEAGSFRSALETVRNLNLEVHRKKGKKQALLDKMMYGDSDVVEDFVAYTQDVISQIKQEQELFRQVRITLGTLTKEREEIIDSSKSAGNEEEFIIIKELTDELEYGYNLHNTLLRDYTDLPSEYEHISEIRLNSLFDRRYQFQESLESHIHANLPNDVHIVDMHPLLLPDPGKTLSLCKIFEPQSVAGKKEEVAEIREKDEMSEKKTIEAIIMGRQADNFSIYAYLLVDALNERGQIDLTSFLDMIQVHFGRQGVENLDLIPFLIELNRGGRQQETEPCRTVFDLCATPEGQSGIKNHLISARTSREAFFDRITVTARPEVRVPISDEIDVYISDLIFTGESSDEI